MIAGIAPDWVVFWIFAPISVLSAMFPPRVRCPI